MHHNHSGAFFFLMIAAEIIKHIEQWAPPGVAWERDNVGLQVGDPSDKLKNVFLCLELSEAALDEAIKLECNFIFTHHPFIFKPLKAINTGTDPKASIIKRLLTSNITLYSAHTNLDYTTNGVSFVLARKLNLNKIDFLVPQEANQLKVVVFTPTSDVEKVSDAVFNCGGGIIGEYSGCSFQSKGKGTFTGSENSNPVIGEKGKSEIVEETRIEFLVDKWKLKKVLKEMLSAHPYEEPAYDIYPLQNKNVNYGAGAIGELPEYMSVEEFLASVSKNLDLQGLRFNAGKPGKIKKVAVCGGSGSDLVNAAIARGADAFVTADVKYHTFQDAEYNILLVDAGHYETEIHVLDEVQERIADLFAANDHAGKVIKFSESTNPIKFYYNKLGDK